jgi:hypothetical protein
MEQEIHYSSLLNQEWEDGEEEDFMDVVNEEEHDADDLDSEDCDGDVVDKELDDEYQAMDSEEDDEWRAYFYFVILHEDEQGHPMIFPEPLQNFGIQELYGSKDTTPCTSLFSSKIRHYLNFHPFPGIGPNDFVYYLDGKRYDPHDPDHDQPVSKRIYSEALVERCDDIYQEARKRRERKNENSLDGEHYGRAGAPDNLHNYAAVVVRRGSTLDPNSLLLPKAIVRSNGQRTVLENVTLNTLLIDLHEKEKYYSIPRSDYDDMIAKVDFPLLFMGWKTSDKKPGKVYIPMSLVHPEDFVESSDDE